MAELNGQVGSPPPTQASTAFALAGPSCVGEAKSPTREVRFKKTHRRNESKLSRVSHLSIRSLRGDTVDEDDEIDGENRKPIYLFDFLVKFCPWMPRLSLPASFRLSRSDVKKRFVNYLAKHKTYDDRIFVVGNKFSEHLFRELNIDIKKVQTKFGGDKKANKYCTSRYTVLTFIPLNLYDQFRRLVNIYFLLSLLFAFFFQRFTPVAPTSWLMSFVFVVAISMIKQGYEDYLRHKSDNQTNRRLVYVIRNGEMTEILAENIVVGDIIYLTDNETIPCDMVVLSTSQDQGQCYSMTANLDGETSLKTKMASPLTKNMRTIEEIDAFVGSIQCENPNPKLDNFLGRMYSFGEMNNHIETCSLSSENMLLTGTQLKNTREVFGVCVYAGKDTKIHLNSLINHNKFSSIERVLNRYLMVFVFILALEMTFSTVMSFDEGVEYMNVSSTPLVRTTKNSSNQNDNHWYMPDQNITKSTLELVTMIVVWNTLYNYIIPISMYVTMEIQKFVGSKFIAWDQELIDEQSGKPPIVRTSDINEELGLVTHLFCDKTGTLTQNIMIFRHYCVNGKKLDRSNLMEEDWNLFIMAMTLCHSVQYTSGHFVASSPDEQAIVEICHWAQFSFWGEDIDGTVTICAKDQIHTYKKLAELQFDSFRKCMSVIVRPKYSSDNDPSQESIYLFVKGAESSVLPNCISGPIEETYRIVDNFANTGLRTLVYAYKEISRDELNLFSEKLEVAKQSIVNRIKYVREVYREMEKGLTLLGATGIEDKLQDKVVQTLDKLQKAGITTWMLTGDKKETALNMAHASGLVKVSQRQIDLCEVLDKKSLYTLIKDIFDNPRDWCFPDCYMVLDGKAVSAIMKSFEIKEKLSTILSKCNSIIACRLSPVQKSQLVTMIKEVDSDNITCAIGDGGNDVSMIQEAHVGLGIIGREGSAASQSADFAITKFCHLQRLLLVHGHWYYTRMAFMVQYSFYKNITCFLCQLYYAFYSNYSGQSLYDAVFLMMFNTIYTLLPVVVYGLTEQKYSGSTLLARPELYKNNRNNSLMGAPAFTKWFLQGLWHSLCIFFTWIAIWDVFELIYPEGHGLRSLGIAIAGASCTVVNFKILLEARYWSWLLVISVFVSLVAFMGVTFIYDIIYMSPMSFFGSNGDVHYTYVELFNSTVLINVAVTTIIVVAALLPDCLWNIFSDMKEKFLNSRKVMPE